MLSLAHGCAFKRVQLYCNRSDARRISDSVSACVDSDSDSEVDQLPQLTGKLKPG